MPDANFDPKMNEGFIELAATKVKPQGRSFVPGQKKKETKGKKIFVHQAGFELRPGFAPSTGLIEIPVFLDKSEFIDKKISKGIFIPNQHRLQPYPKSKNDRSHFEPNEISYAQMKSICIIPSFVLFEAVKDMLDGKK